MVYPSSLEKSFCLLSVVLNLEGDASVLEYQQVCMCMYAFMTFDYLQKQHDDRVYDD